MKNDETNKRERERERERNAYFDIGGRSFRIYEFVGAVGVGSNFIFDFIDHCRVSFVRV